MDDLSQDLIEEDFNLDEMNIDEDNNNNKNEVINQANNNNNNTEKEKENDSNIEEIFDNKSADIENEIQEDAQSDLPMLEEFRDEPRLDFL